MRSIIWPLGGITLAISMGAVRILWPTSISEQLAGIVAILGAGIAAVWFLVTFLDSNGGPKSPGNGTASGLAKGLGRPLGPTADRLHSELEAIAKRGQLMLASGVVTVFGGLGVLFLLIEDFPRQAWTKEALFAFLPRLSVFIFLEIFAYFFLRIYKSGLETSKYFHNELTNVETFLAGLGMAKEINNPTLTAEVVKLVAETDPNRQAGDSSARDDLELRELVKILALLYAQSRSGAGN